MTGKIFGAVDIGSYELELKIYEITGEEGIRVLNTVQHRLDLGKDTFRIGHISADMLEELLRTLEDFVRIMEEYGVENRRVIATSAVREAANNRNIIDQIRRRTGLEVEVLSNSRQRFFGYKAIALKEPAFASIISEPTIIADLGGGSLQLSFYEKNSLMTTKSLPWGFMRIRKVLSDMAPISSDVNRLVEEMIDKDIAAFKRLYMDVSRVRNLIAVGDYILSIIQKAGKLKEKGYVTRAEFDALYQRIMQCGSDGIVKLLDVPYEAASFIVPTAIVYHRLIAECGASRIYAPGITIDDGLVYHYADNKKLIVSGHDFDEDIITAARNIGAHYLSDSAHTGAVEAFAVAIYDRTKKEHRLGKRAKLLLRLSAILHDLGNYVDFRDAPSCTANILRSTELIGMSKRELSLIAKVVQMQSIPVEEIHRLCRDMGDEECLFVEKLTAIFRLANALDAGHRQKFTMSKITIKNARMQITVSGAQDGTMEKSRFDANAGFFAEVFGITPVLKIRKTYE